MISLSERRQQILDEMARLDRLQRGYLSKQFLTRHRNGHTFQFGPYYLLQHGSGSTRKCCRVAADRVPEVEADLAAWRRFEELAEEFVEVTERMTLEQSEEVQSKKNERRSKKASARKPKRF